MYNITNLTIKLTKNPMGKKEFQQKIINQFGQVLFIIALDHRFYEKYM